MRITKQMLYNKIRLIEKKLGLPENSLGLYSYRPSTRRLYKLEFAYDFESENLRNNNFCQFFSYSMYISELYHLLHGILAGIERYEQFKGDTKSTPK